MKGKWCVIATMDLAEHQICVYGPFDTAKETRDWIENKKKITKSEVIYVRTILFSKTGE